MSLFALIAGIGFAIMALVVIWVSEQKQWSTLIAIFGIFATAVTGTYIFLSKTPVSIISEIATPTNVTIQGK